MPASELLDLSINSTLSRTLMVSLATALALIALVIFGGAVIKSFSWAMFFGVVVGTYSSIFIAAPVLIYLGVRNAGDIESADGVEKAGS
jgi:preprotein translocase subunit SecF